MLRKDPECYGWMLDNIAPLVVGSWKYKEESKRVPPTKWMTPSSEAFVVLCMENYYNNIQDIASNSSEIRKPLWTNKGMEAKRNQGWSKEGLERFSAYCKEVKKDRAVVVLQKVDTNYWKDKEAEIDEDEERKRKRDETRDNRERGWEAAHVDEWRSDEEVTKQQREKVVTTARDDGGASSEEENEDGGSMC